ncbi:pirin family protein [Streptomyces sp. NPDC059740]|uniref:pirin family protein n=1 Tax=Streptomyces sp. NPDC059740 TaxID=3346926 RepID=UPI00365C87AD
MIDVRTADRRFQGGDPEAGVTSRHAFSFGPHYDPDNVRFGPIVACNEERLAPGAGFDEHPHRDTEILTWVVEGELTHRDTLTGREQTVRPGDLARLSAGAGVRHVERNAGDRPLRFVQTWLLPREAGGEPSYEVVAGPADGTTHPLEAAGAVLHLWRLPPDAAVARRALPAAPLVYVHVVHGTVELAGHELRAGDAARVADEAAAELAVSAGAECLVWALEAE